MVLKVLPKIIIKNNINNYMEKFALKSKEIILSILVVVNGFLGVFGYPSIDMTPEMLVALGSIFFILRNWFTESKVVWSMK